MKKKQKIIWGIAAILVISLITFLGVKKLTEPTLKERQIAFLKEHEPEMTAYIKRNFLVQIRLNNTGMKLTLLMVNFSKDKV